MSKGGGRHTIVLIQQSPKLDSRTYTDFESVAQALRSLVVLFEDHLKSKRTGGGPLSYDTPALFAYLDNFHDLSMLAFAPHTKSYIPYDRAWIKNAIYQQLQREIQ